MSTFRVSFDEYTVSGSLDALPPAYSALVEHAALHENHGFDEYGGVPLVVVVERGHERRPALVVSLRFAPGPEAGFCPSVLIVPEHQILFLGAGTSLYAYGLGPPHRLWLDECDMGFWGWQRYGDIVVMSAELELAAWDIYGRKLWTTLVEPPWEYQVQKGIVHLDVRGERSKFPLLSGPNL